MAIRWCHRRGYLEPLYAEASNWSRGLGNLPEEIASQMGPEGGVRVSQGRQRVAGEKNVPDREIEYAKA